MTRIMSLEKISENELILASKRHYIELLFSAPFYIATTYITYYLITSIYAYLTYPASLSEWLRALPGLAFMAIFALGLLALAHYLSATIYVQVDRQQQTVSAWAGVLKHKLVSKHVRLSNITTFVARQKTLKSTNNQKRFNSHHHHDQSRTFFLIDAKLLDKTDVTLIKFTKKADAKKWARSLAEFCDTPLNDRL